LCYKVDISPCTNGKKIGSLDVNLENNNNIDNSIKYIEFENKQSQSHLNTTKESRELCYKVNLNSKFPNDKGGGENANDKSIYLHNVDIEEIKNEENSNLDSPSNSNMLSNFSKNSNKSNSIDYGIKKIMKMNKT